MKQLTLKNVSCYGNKKDNSIMIRRRPKDRFAVGWVDILKDDIPALIEWLQAVHDEHEKRERSEECL